MATGAPWPAPVRWRRRGPADRRRRTRHVRQLRAVPAALPDVPGDGRGGAVATRPHRSDARRAVGGRAGHRRLRRVHGDLRAVPRLRAGVPERRAVRQPDGGDPRRRSPAQHRITPWWQRLGFRALGHHRLLLVGSTAARASRSELHLVPAAPRALAGCRCAGRRRCGRPARRVAVHRLRHGRVAARRPPRDRRGARRGRRHVRRCRAAAALLRRAARPRRAGATRRARWPQRGDASRCPAMRRSSSTRPAAARR